MELQFGMPLKFKDSLGQSEDSTERNAFISWNKRLSGKTVYLIGWTDSAYAVVDNLGDYGFEFIGGKPDYLFEPLIDAQQAEGESSCP